MMRLLLLLLAGCAIGQWESVPAEKPATVAELAAWPLSVRDPALAADFERAGFKVVDRPPYKGELELRVQGGVYTLRSDGFFVDEVSGADAAVRLAHSRRVAEFVRNSGLPQQRMLPEH
ncbi:MAG: hypothetical protein ABR567_01060 [Myxococcales bacterium]|nr:hypothetical protein [Myxococcales bacterium]